jgi:hypothetical protein
MQVGSAIACGQSPGRLAIDLPEDTVVNEFTVGPANQPW